MDKNENLVINRVRRWRRWVWYLVGLILVINWGGLAAGMIFRPRLIQTSAQRYEQMRQEASKAAPSAADRIKLLQEKNLFAPKPPKPTAPQATQILGDAAFFGDKWVKVGEEINGAKVVAIDSTSVTLLWEEKEVKQYPFETKPEGGGPGGPQGARPGRPGSNGGQRPAMRPSPEGFGDFGGRPPWAMSPEERSQMRQRFEQMSPEEREAFRNEMRRRFEEGGFGGRGRRGGGGGGGPSGGGDGSGGDR
jgi:uncharacterized membrane protein YgcG